MCDGRSAQGILGPAGAGRQRAKALRRQALIREHGHERTEPGARIAHILVGRILAEQPVVQLTGRDQPALGHFEEGADMAYRATGNIRSHGPEAGDPVPAAMRISTVSA